MAIKKKNQKSSHDIRQKKNTMIIIFKFGIVLDLTFLFDHNSVGINI